MIFNNKFSNILYLKKNKIIYVAIPKAACSSIKLAIAKILNLNLNNSTSIHSSKAIRIHDELIWRKYNLFFLLKSSFIARNKNKNIKTFTVVRNPYSRIFSAWQNKILEKEPMYALKYNNLSENIYPNTIRSIQLSFESFMVYLESNMSKVDSFDNHWKPQSLYLELGNVDYDFIGKVEEFEKVEIYLKHNLNAPEIKLERLNETMMKFNSVFLTPRAVSIIQKIYKDDFKNFGYSLEIPDPKNIPTNLDLFAEKIDIIRQKNHRIAEMMTLKIGSQIFLRLLILRIKQFFSTRKI